METTLQIPVDVREERVRLMIADLTQGEDFDIVEIPNEDVPPDEVLVLRISTL